MLNDVLDCGPLIAPAPRPVAMPSGPLPRMLIVGFDDPRRATDPQPDLVEFCSFAQMTKRVGETPKPDIVVCPLVSKGFDAADVAHILHAKGFRGGLRALTHRRRNLHLISTEIQTRHPRLDFAVLEKLASDRIDRV